MATHGTERTVAFIFEGRTLRGIEGEPVAKALFAAGVRTLSRSVKYGRPRGIFCARGRCVACHMSIDGVPGVPTCITPLRSGMKIEREGYAPFYGPVAAAFVRLIPLPAGFYYRMFTRPAWIRKIFLGRLRRMAGVGRLPLEGAAAPAAGASGRATPLAFKDAYDVIVVGSGLSGMSAALSAAHHGANVLVVDEGGIPGGHSIGHQADAELASARGQLLEKIDEHMSIEHRLHVVAQAFYPPNTLLLGPGSTRLAAGTKARPGSVPPSGMKRVRGRSFVFAPGANDVVPLFENNDTPGIFGERAIRLLLERDAWRPGKRAVVYGAGEALHDAVGLLLHHGIEVAAIVDPTDAKTESRHHGAPGGIREFAHAKIVAANGGEWLRAVEGTYAGSREKFSLACDLLCIALPGQPAYELPSQAGFEYTLSESPLEEFQVMRPVARSRATRSDAGGETISFFLVGEASGERDWKKKIEDGRNTGAEAARESKA